MLEKCTDRTVARRMVSMALGRQMTEPVLALWLRLQRQAIIGVF